MWWKVKKVDDDFNWQQTIIYIYEVNGKKSHNFHLKCKRKYSIQIFSPKITQKSKTERVREREKEKVYMKSLGNYIIVE